LDGAQTVAQILTALGIIPVTSLPLPIAEGGTGAITAAAALADLGGLTGTQIIALINSIVSATYIGNVIYPVIPAETDAGAVITSQAYPPGNVLRYGGDPTGATDLYAPLQMALKVACSASGGSGYGNHVKVKIPAGTYMLATTGALNNPVQTSYGAIRGVVIEGDGMGGTQIKLNTNDGANTLWIFDGTASEGPTGTNPTVQNWIDLTLRDIYFLGDVAVVAGVLATNHGFRWYTSSGFKFYNITLNSFGIGYDSEPQAALLGSGGDSAYWFGCHEVNMSGAVITLNNSQALNWARYGCRSEVLYGDYVRVNQGGGGSFKSYGGSVITQGGTAQTYLLNMQFTVGAVSADNNNTFLFDGLQTEAHVATAGLVYCGPTGAQAPNITFRKCNLTETNGARTSVDIVQAHVLFDDCVMTENQGSGYVVSGPAAGGDQYGDPGSITFQNCEVPINLYSYCSTPVGADSLAWGYISCRNGRWSNNDSGVVRTIRTAIDFDLNWQNQGRAGFNPILKTLLIKPANRQWPDATGNYNWTGVLPVGAIPVRVMVSRQATASSVVMALQVGTQANATAYGTSGASNTNAAQNILYDVTTTPASWAAVSSANNEVIISMTGTASGAAVVGAGGYAIVQYY
jgi:hypothetical protein